MHRRFFRFDGTEVKEIGVTPPDEALAAFVHDDTFKQTLKHPVTGEMVNSLTRWNEINRANNLQVVGNDLHSKEKVLSPQGGFSEAQIMDAIYKAESIADDPSKYRAWQNEQQERLRRLDRLIHGS